MLALYFVVLILICGNILTDILACPLKNMKCVPFSQCSIDKKTMAYPCDIGICCPNKNLLKEVNNIDRIKKPNVFPTKCGTVSTGNRITGGEEADLGQFPWMALLGFRQPGVPITEYLCGGTIITEKYILSAAHCASPYHDLILVRLGEHNLLTSPDCTEFLNTKTCADPQVDVPVEKFLPHPKYSNVTLKNDIALVKVKESIKFTEYIRPICLPFGQLFDVSSFTGRSFIISGWGKTNALKAKGSTVLQFAKVFVWDQAKCNKSVLPEVRPIDSTQLCANGENEDACKGDSGGPLTNFTIDANGDIKFFQAGIVSFASAKTCGVHQLPPVYTRLDSFLDWIVDNVD